MTNEVIQGGFGYIWKDYIQLRTTLTNKKAQPCFYYMTALIYNFFCPLRTISLILSQTIQRTHQCFVGSDITDGQIIQDQADQREREGDLHT